MIQSTGVTYGAEEKLFARNHFNPSSNMYGGDFVGTKFTHMAKPGPQKRPWTKFNQFANHNRAFHQHALFQEPDLKYGKWLEMLF